MDSRLDNSLEAFGRLGDPIDFFTGSEDGEMLAGLLGVFPPNSQDADSTSTGASPAFCMLSYSSPKNVLPNETRPQMQKKVRAVFPTY